jgi:chorismate dehydratase
MAAAPDNTRIGCVSYVNTLPLIHGLDKLAGFELIPAVPAALLDQLVRGETDIALVPIVDFQRSSKPLQLIPAGMIGCDGPTYTVRLYSSCPPAEITTVHADIDSHTSVILMQILLREMHNVTPRIVPFNARERTAEGKVIEWPDAVLMIGDKVVTDSPPSVRYPYQLDLGEAWRVMTDLPFVYAMWMCRDQLTDDQARRIGAAAATLDRQRRHNLQRIDQFIALAASPRGWPTDLARRYFTEMLRYAVGPREREAVDVFFDKAHQLGLLPRRRETTWLS